MDREIRKILKLRKRIQEKPILEGPISRPAYMHKKTFEAIATEIISREEEVMNHIYEQVRSDQ